jgi:hypothetical protein
MKETSSHGLFNLSALIFLRFSVTFWSCVASVGRMPFCFSTLRGNAYKSAKFLYLLLDGLNRRIGIVEYRNKFLQHVWECSLSLPEDVHTTRYRI